MIFWVLCRGTGLWLRATWLDCVRLLGRLEALQVRHPCRQSRGVYSQKIVWRVRLLKAERQLPEWLT